MVRFCKKCGGVLEFGLPYNREKGKVVNLWCYNCRKIVKTLKIEGKS
jgi:hypothetical protein